MREYLTKVMEHLEKVNVVGSENMQELLTSITMLKALKELCEKATEEEPKA